MALSVEVEVTGSTFNGVDNLACTFTYRLINEANQSVVASKSATLNITDAGKIIEPEEIMRNRIEDATKWAQWLVMSNKASQYIGAKKRVPL